MKTKIIFSACLVSVLTLSGCGSAKETSESSVTEKISVAEESSETETVKKTNISEDAHGIVNYANNVIFYNGTALASEITDDFKYSQEYLTEHMPEEYSVTYIKNSPDGKVSEKSLTITKEGVYSSDGEHENLYIKKDENTYYSYSNYESDVFTKMNIDRDADTVKAWCYLDEFIHPYTPSMISHNLTGMETVCGYECEVYNCPLEVITKDENGKQITDTEKYYINVYIEPQTGFCLKYTSNIGENEGDYDFECKEFKTENVTLPEYQ